MLKNTPFTSGTKSSVNPKVMLAMSLLVGMSTNGNLAHADERESLEQLRATTSNLIELLVQEGVLNKDKAEAIVKKANQDAAKQVQQAKADKTLDGSSTLDEKSVRVQYVPEHIKKRCVQRLKKKS